MTPPERGDREEQLAYSEQMAAMLDETKRGAKAAKILAVVRHALGRADLTGLRALDVGCVRRVHRRRAAGTGAQTTRCRHRRAGPRRGTGALRAPRRLPRHARGRGAARSTTPAWTSSSSTTSTSTWSTRLPWSPTSTGSRPGRTALPRRRPPPPGRRAALQAPFLSWLPQRTADRYLQVTRKGEHYYEHYYSRGGLRELFAASTSGTTPCRSWPIRPRSTATTSSRMGRSSIPSRVLAAALPAVPTYIWARLKEPATPPDRRCASPRATSDHGATHPQTRVCRPRERAASARGLAGVRRRRAPGCRSPGASR